VVVGMGRGIFGGFIRIFNVIVDTRTHLFISSQVKIYLSKPHQ
jgi:hypothetical protein